MNFMLLYIALAFGFLLGTSLLVFALAARKKLPPAMIALFIVLGAAMDIACGLMGAGILSSM